LDFWLRVETAPIALEIARILASEPAV
jgi:hypothetical protein